ncbi:MAG: hypothetical protein AB1810_03645 [Pseudomonadota bacterium]
MNVHSLIIVFVVLVWSAGCSDSELRAVKGQTGDAVANNSGTPAQGPTTSTEAQPEDGSQTSLSQSAGTEAALPEQVDREIKGIVDKITSLPGNNDLSSKQLEEEIKGVVKQLEASNAGKAE